VNPQVKPLERLTMEKVRKKYGQAKNGSDNQRVRKRNRQEINKIMFRPVSD